MRDHTEIDFENQYLEYEKDALQIQREVDANQVEELLKSHEILGNFFRHHWNVFKSYVRVEEYHQGILFLKHECFSKKVYVLIEGEVSAYILTDQSPKPIVIYDFKLSSILTDVNALLGSRRHYGFMAKTDCQVISFDLEYIEDEIEDHKVYIDFIDALYPESGKRTAELCNIALEQKLDLRDMLTKHNFFSDINKLSDEDLNTIADKLKYIYLPDNEVLIDEVNKDKIYLIEAGTVVQTKSYKEFEDSDSYIYTRSLQEVYVNNEQNNLQEVFAKHMKLEEKLNVHSSFAESLGENTKGYKIADNSHLEIKSPARIVDITEDIHRYGVVGEDILSERDDVRIIASTKTPCCLIEIDRKVFFDRQGMISQVIGFFNNKINDMQAKVVRRQEQELSIKNKYITLVNFSFMFMVIMATLGISGRFHGYLNLSSHGALAHHITFISVICLLLARLIKPLNFKAHDFGLTKINLRKAFMQAFLGILFIITLSTGIKEGYVILHAHQFGMQLFQPDLVINENLSASQFYIFILLYVVYIFIYELCARGILQNIFSIILAENPRTQYWGSIFAASAVASQFHMSLFHEFSITLFMGNIVAGIIFANTRNLWAAIAFHSVFSVYILTVLGLLPGSHF